jgi:DnaJ-class molecular chaperone
LEYRDYYKVLDVDRKASQEEIKKKYRKLARTCHPDMCKNDPGAEKRFKEVNEAYEVLGDPRSASVTMPSEQLAGRSVIQATAGLREFFFRRHVFFEGRSAGRRDIQLRVRARCTRGHGFRGILGFFETLFGDPGMGRRPGHRSAPPKGGTLKRR